MNNCPSTSTRSLQDQCLQVCSRNFSSLTSFSGENLKGIHKYLEIASPLVQKIAKKCHYHFSGKKTLIFIPFLIQKGKLIITDQNINEVIQWIDSLNNPNGVITEIHKLTINAHRPENYFKFLAFTPKISSITKLVLNTWTNDDILAAIGVYCKKLEILDARDDDGTIATDTGLGFLAQCKTLKMVLFSNLSDEYDYEDKFKFSGKGIALLMLSLPKLDRIECPEYLLRDSLHYIYQMNFQNQALPLKCIFLDYPDVPVKTINILPILCPYLEKLSLYIPCGKEPILKSTLKRFLNLKNLKLKFEDSCKIDSSLVNSNLQVEYLIIDVQYIHEENVYLLDSTFKMLKTLVLIIHSFGFVPSAMNRISAMSIDYFQNLHTLQVDQRVSGSLFKLINLKIKTLKAVYCQHAIIYDAENAIEYIISNGGWLELIILALPQNCFFGCNFLLVNLAKVKKLKFVCAKFMNATEEKNFIASLNPFNLNIQLCSTDELPLPSKDFMAI